MGERKWSPYWTVARLAWLRKEFHSRPGHSLRRRIRAIARMLGRTENQITHALYYYQITISASVGAARKERAARRVEDAAARDRFWRSNHPKLRMW
jgi:hypothetical protein